jgi:hypothetical protein
MATSQLVRPESEGEDADVGQCSGMTPEWVADVRSNGV